METDIVLNCSMPPLPSEAWRPSDRNNFEARVGPQIAAVQLQDVVNTLFSPQESSDCCEDCKATHHSMMHRPYLHSNYYFQHHRTCVLH